MLSSSKIGTLSWRYYTQSVACSAAEYYLDAREAPGRWGGRGLPELGLEAGAVVSEAQLEALFARALNPTTGERLGRAWRVDGVTGFDLTFSAPKSVSSLWAVAEPTMAGELRAAHTAAVQSVLSYLDTHASWSRRGMDGTEQVASAGLAAATFEHRTSRCADPQLHTHALVVNKVRCVDGAWRSLDATELYHHKKSAGMIYQAALRSEIHARTGLIFEAVDINGQAEIGGMPDGLLKLWSKRTAAIELEAAGKVNEFEASLGRSLTDAERVAVTKTAVLKTRPSKRNQAGSLRDRWAAEAAGAGFEPLALLQAAHEAAQREGWTASGRAARQAPGLSLAMERTVISSGVVNENPIGGEVMAGAIEAAAGLRATFSRADVAGQVAARLPVEGRSAEQVVTLIEQLTDRALDPAQGMGCPEAVPVGEQPQGRTRRASDARWAGAEVLAAEARVLSLAERGRGAGYGRVPAAAAVITAVEVSVGGVQLDPDQAQAVRAITEGGDFLSVLTAPAGAGKTRTLGAATAAWRDAGYRVIGLAPSARGAAELATATGTGDTLAKWVHDHGRRGLLMPEQRARTVLDSGAVVIVDEASMANTHDLDTLITAAARAAAKVVLVGDPAQIGVVNGPGGMLAALIAAGHGIELETVHRFSEDWERVASIALRRGYPAVLTAYQGHDRIHACDDTAQAVGAVHAHWLAERTAGREVLMMARTRADVELLNYRARASAQAAGDSHGPSVWIGERDWQTGDLVRTRRNDRRLAAGDEHVRNGDRWRVLSADAAGLHVTHLDRGDKAFLPAPYVAAHAEYGWAATIDGAQGATVDVGLVLVRPGIDREHLYVGLSRGREANHAYVIPNPADIGEHHGLPPAGTRRGSTPEERALDVLETGLARTGAQDAAHTAREDARSRAAEQARRAAQDAARRPGEPAIPAEHAARAGELRQRQEERDQLTRVQREHRHASALARTQLQGTSHLRPARRRELTETINRHEHALRASYAVASRLDTDIERLSRQVAADTQAQEAERRALALRPAVEPTGSTVPDEAYLRPSATSAPSQDGAREGTRRARERAAQQPFRAPERRRRMTPPMPGRTRDDGPGISR